jgi:hypothetical protein
VKLDADSDASRGGFVLFAQDLSTALGKFSVVFNCTEAIDLTCLGNVMKGMATTGAWLLLDNFHAMRPVVTSTLAMQALALRTALLQGKTEVMLDGMLLSPIEKSFGMHVTSTPRLDSTHPLPEDLKVRIWEEPGAKHDQP